MSRARTHAAAEPAPSPVGVLALPLLLALSIVVVDQITKLMIDSSMRLHQSIPVVEGFINLTYVRNTGGAFSLLADAPAGLRIPLFVGVAFAAVVGLVWYLRSLPREDWLSRVACGLVLGGAVGNLVDRVLQGSVVDFVDVYVAGWHWPAFNVADSGISIGVVLLLLRSWRG